MRTPVFLYILYVSFLMSVNTEHEHRQISYVYRISLNILETAFGDKLCWFQIILHELFIQS